MTAPAVLLPNTDLVATAWGRRIPKLATWGAPVATRLPNDHSILRTKGFVVVRGVGGSPDVYTPMRRPVVTFECWVAPAEDGSAKIPWGLAAQLAEWVWEATTAQSIDGIRMQQVRLPMPLPGYAEANVFTVNAIGEPRKITGDPSNYARFDQDVEITWTGVPA